LNEKKTRLENEHEGGGMLLEGRLKCEGKRGIAAGICKKKGEGRMNIAAGNIVGQFGK